MDVTFKSSIYNLILLPMVVFLFLHIKWYFSRLSSNVKNRLHYSEIMIGLMVAMFTFLLISNKHIDIFYRYIYFILSVILYFSINLLIYLHILFLKRNKKVFPKSYLIYHA